MAVLSSVRNKNEVGFLILFYTYFLLPGVPYAALQEAVNGGFSPSDRQYLCLVRLDGGVVGAALV